METYLDVMEEYGVGEPNHIIDGLFIGSYESTASPNLLNDLNIKAIVIVARGLKSPPGFPVLVLPVEDWHTFNILPYFESAFNFINEHKAKGNVLVHCAAGVSRSATICIAYLMKAKGLTFKESRDLVKQARGVAYPNEGFLRQLRLFECFGTKVLTKEAEEGMLWLLEHEAKRQIISPTTVSNGLAPETFLTQKYATELIQKGTLSRVDFEVRILLR